MLTEVLATLFSGVVLFVTYYVYYVQSRPKNFPPGPWGVPILGNVLQFGLEPFHTFNGMRKQYGDIIGLRLGSQLGIVLHDPKHIREAFNETATSGRQQTDFTTERCGGKVRGVIFTDGKAWTEQRRFTIRTLRDFGFGKKSMEGLVQEEVKELIDTLKKTEGKPMSTHNVFNAPVLNALWSIVTGKRYPHDDPVLGDLIKRLTSGIQRPRPFAQLVIFFPIFIKLPFFRKRIEKFRMDSKETMKFLQAAISSHKESFQENSPRDFIDVYLEEVHKTTDPDSTFYGEEGENHLRITMLDMFVAGAETTSTTLTWVFRLLALFPEAQEALFKEIETVVGDSRLPSLSDRPNMPLTEATIMEVMRFSSLVPMGLTHNTLTEFSFHGYTIPAGTLIMPNLYAAMHDPAVWGDPEVFRPSRFLSKDGSTVVRHEAFLPFSVGKRVCLGETLARDELFLFTTSLFQKFRVGTDPAEINPSPAYIASVVISPQPHHLILTDRQCI